MQLLYEKLSNLLARMNYIYLVWLKMFAVFFEIRLMKEMLLSNILSLYVRVSSVIYTKHPYKTNVI